ncbi:MAG: hypothetical protein ACT6U0_18970, partial [Shinella sp.]
VRSPPPSTSVPFVLFGLVFSAAGGRRHRPIRPLARDGRLTPLKDRSSTRAQETRNAGRAARIGQGDLCSIGSGAAFLGAGRHLAQQQKRGDSDGLPRDRV